MNGSTLKLSYQMEQLRSASVAIFLLFLLTSPAEVAWGKRATDTPLRIDCGSSNPSDQNGTQWEADKYFEGGSEATIPLTVEDKLSPVEASLRAFPPKKVSCYNIPVETGRYLVRLGFGFFNYDRSNQPPYFNILLQDTLVEVLDMGVVQGVYYSDYIAFSLKKKVRICLSPVVVGGVTSSESPIINSIEILPFDTDAYDANRLGEDAILSSYLRLNMAGPSFGPEPQDPGFRRWSGDFSPAVGNYTLLATSAAISGVGTPPDYLPERVFQTARMAGAPDNITGFSARISPVSPKNRWYLRYYFAELNTTAEIGDRVFDVLVGSFDSLTVVGDSGSGFDILNRTQGAALTGYVLPVFFNFSNYARSETQRLIVGVGTRKESKLPAILNGVELYEVIPYAPAETTSSSSSSSSSNGLSAGAIAGIVIGSVVGLFIIAGAIALIVMAVNKRRQFNAFQSSV